MLFPFAAAIEKDYMYWVTYTNCVSCYSYHTACINADFTESHCCAWDESDPAHDKCIDYKDAAYCTHGVEQSHYKGLTCPPQNCPYNAPTIVEHTVFDQRISGTLSWGTFEQAYNCKLKFSAKSELNGKLNVVITSVDDIRLRLFEMPNKFSDEYGTKGILENNRYYSPVRDNSHFTVPTDWTIIGHYSPSIFSGHVKFETWVSEFEE